MPSPGLSLVGFLDQAPALQHLRGTCVSGVSDDAALTAIWTGAHGALGQPIPNAGNPNIQPLSPLGVQHVALLAQQQHNQQLLATVLAGAMFQMVEIEPLLAYQITVDTARSNHHGNGASTPPTEQELMDICLPVAPVQEQLNISTAPGSLLVKSRGLNFHVLGEGFLHGAFLGFQVGVSIPFAHVVRFNGRCFLHNGFHRALALRARGATHMPCVFRDVGSYAEVGILPEGTFQPPLLESANPPTVGHFTQGRALATQLKTFSRTLHISWAQYITTED